MKNAFDSIHTWKVYAVAWNRVEELDKQTKVNRLENQLKT